MYKFPVVVLSFDTFFYGADPMRSFDLVGNN